MKIHERIAELNKYYIVLIGVALLASATAVAQVSYAGGVAILAVAVFIIWPVVFIRLRAPRRGTK
ncbi:TPA_asm: membrane protein [Mycobacterium phage McProf]|nr:TPA_asm: membrane protein [Mycobacterium phage McProf]